MPFSRQATSDGPLPAHRLLHQFSEALGAAIDAKDAYTRRHSEQVAEIAHIIARGMGMDEMQVDIIHVAGHLHDIGKIGVPNHILRKKGPLTDLEWEYIRRHPDIGADILRPVEALAQTGVVEMVRHHHERFDGGGYPSGLKGRQIPKGARIICLADTLSAILQNRPYRCAGSFKKAEDEITRHADSQFDPEVVAAFLSTRDEICTLLSCLCPMPGSAPGLDQTVSSRA